MVEDKNIDFGDDSEELDDQVMYEHHKLEVDPGQKMLRVDKYLVNRIDNASRSRIQAAADAGNILVNGPADKSNYKVTPGTELAVV
nr:RNA pseudouridine synthase [Sunxiuqinia sp.]